MEAKLPEKLENFEVLIGGKYALDIRKKLNTGKCKSVYCGRELKTNKLVAIKYEYKFEITWCISDESDIYDYLKGIEHIPKKYMYGEEKEYFYLVIELLGNTLQNIMDSLDGKFTLATTLKISLQVLKILEDIHKKGVVLRYLKPENMALGYGENKDYIYLFDFGLAKRYIRDGEHKPYKEGKNSKGNKLFISVNIHFGRQVSRRDDIESFGYNLIYFMKGKLPWSEYYRDTEKIQNIKSTISLDELCQGLPEEFKEFIKYGKEMKFTEEPDYKYLNSLLLKVAEKNDIDINSVKYDWDINKEKKLLNENKVDTSEKIDNK